MSILKSNIINDTEKICNMIFTINVYTLRLYCAIHFIIYTNIYIYIYIYIYLFIYKQ